MIRSSKLLLFCLTLLLLPALGCGGAPEPAPPIDTDVRAAVEREDALVHEMESQQ